MLESLSNPLKTRIVDQNPKKLSATKSDVLFAPRIWRHHPNV